MPNNNKELITIEKDLYDSLVANSNMLDCLHAVGVDNWNGYSDATALYEYGESENSIDESDEY